MCTCSPLAPQLPGRARELAGAGDEASRLPPLAATRVLVEGLRQPGDHVHLAHEAGIEAEPLHPVADPAGCGRHLVDADRVDLNDQHVVAIGVLEQGQDRGLLV
jgi:hypothetical protein